MIEKLSVSIIDVIGKIDDGVALLLNLVLEDNSYEIGYWFNRTGYVRIVPDAILLKQLNIESIYEYKYYEEFIYLIHSNIPNIEMIFEEYL